MDVAKLMKNIKNLNDYVEITHDVAERTKSSKIQLNMSIVLALKKIRSFEIEYFSKYEQNGLACILLERMLNLPPSKTWGVLGQELVALLQYWLDAVRKHLVKRSVRWWTFLKLLLRFIKDMRIKDASLPNLLVEHTAECLLDLAAIDKPNASQKYEVLHCLNMYCSESSREIRFALRSKFAQYFTKLAHYMANCGHLPTQYSILETLLRWLLPRQDHTLRVMSIAKWFPAKLYNEHTANIFLERPWLNFFQDARDFLNSHNTRSELITSVVCRRLVIGQLVIITGMEHQQSWLDVNVSTKCLSVLLDPKLLEVFGVSSHKAFETLVVTQDNTDTAKLHRESLGLTVSVHTTRPPRALPSRISLGDDVGCDVTVVLTSHCDIKRLDTALRNIFDDKYQLLMDIEEELQLSPIPQPSGETSRVNNDEEARFSLPVGVKRRKHSGYIVKQHTKRCMSPSTASTSSLLQLHEKLAALPKYNFEKEPVSVCARPELSIVSEVSETDDRQSLNSTLKIRSKPYGVTYKSLFNNIDKKSQSDPENSKVVYNKKILESISENKSQSDPESSKFYRKRALSPTVNEPGPSCLLVATIGSADDSIINETVEKLSKKKDYDPENIVDLLVQEALEAPYKEKEGNDSGINTGEKRIEDILENSEAIENTPNTEVTVKKTKEIKTKVISSTSDESNTEAINDTPLCFVSTRKKQKENLDSGKKTFDVQVVEQFFSQHFAENGGSEAIISPTLAKKINETSSETSDNFGDEYNNLLAADLHEDIELTDFNNIEVIQCLNSMVDKVCNEFEKCTQYLDDNDKPSEPVESMPLQDILNTIEEMESTSAEAEKVERLKMNTIKLQYKVKTPRKLRSRIPKKINKVDKAKTSTIVEDENPIKEIVEAVQIKTNAVIETAKENLIEDNSKDEVINDMPVAIPEKTAETKTPVVSRKKRKLYSPKDEEIETINKPTIELIDNTFAEAQMKTPKPTATSYKDIEKDRRKLNNAPRTRRNKKTEMPSPRSKKMNDIFDKVKHSANSESVRLADKTFEIDVYNFSSDSEEEFKQKKIASTKKNSSATVSSAKSTTTKRGRKIKVTKYSDYMSSDDCKAKPKVTRRTRSKKKAVDLDKINLVDERMREAKADLNTSIIVDNTINVIEEPQLVLEAAPVMEIIEDKVETKRTRQPKRKVKKPKVNSEHKRLEQVLEIEPCCEDDRTVSPLPSLVEETVINTKDDHDLSANMVDKFKKIYRDGPEKYINESNTTQNLLSDIEKVNYSPKNNITEDLELLEAPFTNDIEQNNSKKYDAKTKLTKTKVIKIKKEILSNFSNNKHEDVIELYETFETKSEKSIATVGITGHGELDEAPPTPNLIRKTLSPRNLEIQDMDNSMQEYFNKLTNQLNTSRPASENKSKTASEKSASPVVCISILSPNDIRRWLPSQRNSETDNSSEKSKKINSPKVSTIIDESPKSILRRKCKENELTKSSHLSNVSKHEYDVFNNMKQNINSESDKNNSEDSENEVTIRKSLRIRNKRKKAAKTKDTASVATSDHYNSDSNDSENTNTKRQQKNTKTKITQSGNKFKSVITPIKLFGDLISNTEMSQSTLSEDEEYIKDIMNCLKNRKDSKDRKGKELRAKKVIQDKVIEEELKNMDDSPKSVLTQENVKVNAKRKAEEQIVTVKRQKTKESVIDLSGATVSSVDEWFKRNEPTTSRAETLNISLKDSLRHIMEKLDTTLVEINQSTSKKFVHLFVDTQKHLSRLKEQRCALYKRAATDILTQVVQIMDDKFADLDKRSQEQDNEFMKRLKEGAAALIRQDCNQKRLMVRLLKEDIEAVANHLRTDTDI